MPLAPPIYRKSPDYPIYYRIDFARRSIESIKDWEEGGKSIDEYEFFPEFAENISEIYEPISRTTYLIIRAYVVLQQNNSHKAADLSEPPQCAIQKT